MATDIETFTEIKLVGEFGILEELETVFSQIWIAIVQ